MEEFRQPAAARANAVAQCDVDIAAGPTSLDPSQTSFFQALGISTKIQKGAFFVAVAEAPSSELFGSSITVLNVV